MNSKRLFQILSASLVVLLIAMVGLTYVISGLLHTKSLQLATGKAQAQQLSNAETSIAKSKRDIATYSPLAAVTKKIVPQDKDQAAAVREITNIASASNVPITSITFPSSTLGSTVVKTPAAAAPAAAATRVTPNLSQLTKVINIPGVYDLQITIANNSDNPVNFTQLNSFLQGLENNRRTAAVSTIDIQPNTANHNVLVYTLTLNAYIKP